MNIAAEDLSILMPHGVSKFRSTKVKPFIWPPPASKSSGEPRVSDHQTIQVHPECYAVCQLNMYLPQQLSSTLARSSQLSRIDLPLLDTKCFWECWISPFLALQSGRKTKVTELLDTSSSMKFRIMKLEDQK